MIWKTAQTLIMQAACTIDPRRDPGRHLKGPPRTVHIGGP